MADKPQRGRVSLSVWPMPVVARFLADQTTKTIRFPGRVPLILKDHSVRSARWINSRITPLREWVRQRAIRLRAGEYGSKLSPLDRLKKARKPDYHPKPRRVLMVVSTMTRAGCERRLIATAEGLIGEGYSVGLLVLRPGGFGDAIFEAEFKKLGAKLVRDVAPAADGSAGEANHTLFGYPLFLPEEHRCARAIAHFIRIFRPDVVHGWGDEAAIMAGMVACLLGVPRVVLGQTAIAPVHFYAGSVSIHRDRYRALSKNPAVTLATNSHAAATDYEKWIGLPNNTVHVIYNGLSPATVRVPTTAGVAAYRASLGFPEVAPIIGSVMRFEQQKDPMLWLQTAAEIAQTRTDARFLIVGYGSLRNDIISALKTLGLEGRCAVLGPVIDVGLVYATLDLFLMTSYFEGLPNTLIEAQSVGIPIIATDYLGVQEAVDEGITGIIVRERSPSALAQSVVDVLDRGAWRRRARIQGPAFVRRHFSHQRMVADTIEHYELSTVQRSLRYAAGLSGCLNSFANVCNWHLADVTGPHANVRFRG